MIDFEALLIGCYIGVGMFFAYVLWETYHDK